MSLFTNVIRNAQKLCVLCTLPKLKPQTFMHTLIKPQNVKMLMPQAVNLMQTAGFKVKGRLRRRCKDCFFVRRQERLYVICNTHRRHKQMEMVKDEKNTWILSHATQGKIRPW